MPPLRAQPDHGHVLPSAALGLEFMSSPGCFCYPELRSHPEVPHLPSAPKGSDLGVPTFRKGADAASASRGHPGAAGKALGWRCGPGPGALSGHQLLCNMRSHFLLGPALLVGGGVRGQATPPCNCSGVSRADPGLKTPWSRLFVKFSLGSSFFLKT